MNLTAKNRDAVTPDERLDPLAEEKRIPWVGVAAVLAFLCLAWSNVQHRDAMVVKDERIAKLESELALYKPVLSADVCVEYAVHMERLGITHCRKPGWKS